MTYWRETNQQITFAGHVEPADSGLSDVLWRQGPAQARAMAVTTAQSEPLADQKSLLLRARTRQRLPLPRPRTWVAHHLVITEVEFWQSSPDRLYRRLRYDLTKFGWAAVLRRVAMKAATTNVLLEWNGDLLRRVRELSADATRG